MSNTESQSPSSVKVFKHESMESTPELKSFLESGTLSIKYHGSPYFFTFLGSKFQLTHLQNDVKPPKLTSE